MSTNTHDAASARDAPGATAGKAEMEPLLVVDGVGKKYGGVWAVADVTLRVPCNQILGIIGPNGAGKTTLFNLIAGAVPASAGRMIFRGHDITRYPPHKRARRGIGRTFQLTRPIRSLSVRDNLRLAALASGAKAADAQQRTERILTFLGLEPMRAKRGSELNAVESKRLEVGRALVIGPSLLLLDEIFSGSNADEVDELIGLVHQLRQDGLTVLVIEHNVRAIRAVADRVMAMNAGKVISEGTADHVFGDPQVIESYLGQQSQT
jgi:ABC-type branched-subunit amino acid transport system ATPase component